MTTDTYPITYAILGLLTYSGAMSGYDLKQLFDLTLSGVWNAAHSQIYNELRRMTALGWLEMEHVDQQGRPDKKLYHVTDAGKNAMREWQAQHPTRITQLRDETLLRFLFGSLAQPSDLAQTLREAISEHEQRLAQYRINQQCLPPTPSHAEHGTNPDRFFALSADFGIRLEQFYLDWLHEVLATLEGERNA